MTATDPAARPYVIRSLRTLNGGYVSVVWVTDLGAVQHATINGTIGDLAKIDAVIRHVMAGPPAPRPTR